MRHYTATVGGELVRIAAVGRGKRFGPLLRPWVGELQQRSVGPRRAAWRPDALATLGADMVAVEVHRWLASRFRRAGWIVVPDAVRWVGDSRLIPPVEPNRSAESDLQTIARYGYTLEIAGTPEDWTEFYDEMVVPHARRRFGADLWLPSRRLRREFASRGILQFVRRGGRRVAGTCAIPTGTRLWYPLLGVRADDPALLRQAPTAAAMVLSAKWARENGFQQCDMGRTSPFLSDGVQRFKRKWGLEPVRDPLAHLVALRIDPAAIELRRALAREPVLVEADTGLEVFGAPAP